MTGFVRDLMIAWPPCLGFCAWQAGCGACDWPVCGCGVCCGVVRVQRVARAELLHRLHGRLESCCCIRVADCSCARKRSKSNTILSVEIIASSRFSILPTAPLLSPLRLAPALANIQGRAQRIVPDEYAKEDYTMRLTSIAAAILTIGAGRLSWRHDGSARLRRSAAGAARTSLNRQGQQSSIQQQNAPQIVADLCRCRPTS